MRLPGVVVVGLVLLWPVVVRAGDSLETISQPLSRLEKVLETCDFMGFTPHPTSPLEGRGAMKPVALSPPAHGSGTSQILRVLTLRDYNTRVVVTGTALLGLASGIIGTFMLLRKRALMGDALSHATLPGIAVAFIVMVSFGGDGKFLPGLLIGATVSSLLGIAAVLLIRNLTRLKEDVALGVVLSVFFGLGVALLGVIQTMKQGNAAGLESFIYGKTASMLSADAMMIAVAAAVVAVICALLFKEFGMVCFDQQYSSAQGWPVVLLDVIMMSLVVAVTVIGLQAVGLILIVALLIIPPAAARFWTDHLPRMVVVSALIGALSGLVGAGLSAVVPRLPAGAVIVTVAAAFFLISLIFGPARGVLKRAIEHRRLSRKVAKQHLLRAMYEQAERTIANEVVDSPTATMHSAGVTWDALWAARSWSPSRLRRMVNSAKRRGLIRENTPDRFSLTDTGLADAARVMRNHRLWELYLITHADIAPSHVDRDADQIEHVLGRDMVSRLEDILAHDYPQSSVPPSPHTIVSGPGIIGS